ncbi:MAG TPA: hypothetical protein VLQ48_03785 [Chloroflexia bacterium]|nr:hypothetical protein [Chloroflexia bacterium]
MSGIEDGESRGEKNAPSPMGSSEFEEMFGEPISSALDLNTWQTGVNLEEMYNRMGDEQIAAALRYENGVKPAIRKFVFDKIRKTKDLPDAGVYKVTPGQVERAHKGLLFTGAVEAVDGTFFTHETLPLTVNQIGICSISYRGDQGTYMHRLYRRDLRAGGVDDIDTMLNLLQKRMDRGAVGSNEGDDLTILARRGIMSYAERAVLLEKCEARWRMGHGNPTPLELLTGSGSMEFLAHSLDMLRRLLLDYKTWVFVPSAPRDALLLTIGQALDPLEYAIIETAESRMENEIKNNRYDPYHTRLATDFVHDVGSRIVRGVYRASKMAPPYVFYAHADRAHEAALIAMADSTMHEHRGFPMLIDLADRICASTFGAQALATQLEVSYAAQGVPFEYLPERYTRKG